MANVIVDKEWLENGLTEIADSIRAKTGEQDALEFPLGMKAAVDSIGQGGAADDMLKVLTKDGEDFSYFWCEARYRFPIDGTKLPMPDTSKGTRFVGTFRNAVTQQIPLELDTSSAVITDSMLEAVNADGGVACMPRYDMSALVLDIRNVESAKVMCSSTYFCKFPTIIIGNKLKNAYRMFFNNSWLTDDYVLDALANASGVEVYNGTFRMCSAKSIVVNVDSAKDCGSMFDSCNVLENLTLNGTLKVSLSLVSCKKLTAQSIDNVITALADLTGGTTQTLTLPASLPVTDAQKAAITLKNWTLVQ